jgi:hypothetical protein
MSTPDTQHAATPGHAHPADPAADTAVTAALTETDVPLWPSERKLRLYACGCCRQVWHRLAPPCRRAVVAAERYADGLARVNELARAWRACRKAEDGRPIRAVDPAAGAQYYQTTELVHRVAAPVITPADVQAVALDLRPWRGDDMENDAVDAACQAVADDVFGPATPVPPLNPAWRSEAVLALARAVYKGQAFDGLPALADALEEAGCTDAALLGHLRSAAPHVRGCWALDHILELR